MAEMFFEVRLAASPTVPHEYQMSLCYADEAFEHLNPYRTETLTIVDSELLEDNPNWVFFDKEAAKTFLFDQSSQAAIDDLNTFMGSTYFTLAFRIRTDQDTWNDAHDLDSARFSDLSNLISNKQEFHAILESLCTQTFEDESVVTMLSNTTVVNRRITEMGKALISAEDAAAVKAMMEMEGADIVDLGDRFDDFLNGSGVLDRLDTAESKLSGIANGATANDTDANLKNRSNHTGSQAISTITGLQAALDSKASSSHSHAISEVTGLQTALDAKVPTTRTVNGHALTGNINVTRSDLSFVAAATNIADSATNAPTDASTSAASDNPTNYNLLSGLLGVADGLNSANTKQNSMAVIVNGNATKQNAGFAILNTLAGKFNLSLDILEGNALMAA